MWKRTLFLCGGSFGVRNSRANYLVIFAESTGRITFSLIWKRQKSKYREFGLASWRWLKIKTACRVRQCSNSHMVELSELFVVCLNQIKVGYNRNETSDGVLPCGDNPYSCNIAFSAESSSKQSAITTKLVDLLTPLHSLLWLWVSVQAAGETLPW